MEKKKIAVLFGGCSPEYGVSLLSAHAIITNINTDRYEPVLIGITAEGSWYRYYGDVAHIPSDDWHAQPGACVPAIISPDRKVRGLIEFTEQGNKITPLDAAFPVLHGKNGEDGTVQGLIELAGIPLIGCNTMSSALGMDKDKAHKIVQAAGVAAPKAMVITSIPEESRLLQLVAPIGFPLYVKPVKAGSSYGISKVYQPENLMAAVKTAFEYDNEVIIEENIEGFEVGCAVLGNEDLIIGAVDEIEVEGGFFDYTEKYMRKTAQIHMPARIDKPTADRIKDTATIIYKALGCEGFTRVDMFLTPDDRIVFNEVNTIPGCTLKSRYPAMLQGIGLSYADLVEKLIELGLSK